MYMYMYLYTTIINNNNTRMLCKTILTMSDRTGLMYNIIAHIMLLGILRTYNICINN